MSSWAMPERAFVREVAESYASCLREDASARIDVARAKEQHAAYVAALRGLGIAVEVVPAEAACADSCFIEDTAVVLGEDAAVLTCPGAPSRRPEVDGVGAALERTRFRVRRMRAPATLDGGDVLRAGARLFVGLSTRTNRAGAEMLADAARPAGIEVVTLEVRDGLHLKSACTLAHPQALLYDARVLGERELAVFRGADLACVAAPEREGANVLALGRAALVSAAAPRTADLLAARGVDVRVVDVGEFHKGDGALTCLSLRVPARGAWVT